MTNIKELKNLKKEIFGAVQNEKNFYFLVSDGLIISDKEFSKEMFL